MVKKISTRRWRIAIPLKYGTPRVIWAVAIILSLSVYSSIHVFVGKAKSAILESRLRNLENTGDETQRIAMRGIVQIETALRTAATLSAKSELGDLNTLRAMLQVLVSSNLLIRDLALVSNDGQVMVAATPGTTSHGLTVPPELLEKTLKSSIVISREVPHFATGEQVLYFILPSTDKLSVKGAAWLAIVPVATLQTYLGFSKLSAISATLEQEDGTVVLGSPDGIAMNGQKLPRLADELLGSPAVLVEGRTNHAEVALVARSLPAYKLRVVASTTKKRIFGNWESLQLWLYNAALIMCFVLLITAAILHNWLRQNATARARDRTKAFRLNEAFNGLPAAVLLTDVDGKLLYWSNAVNTFFPRASGKLVVDAPVAAWVSQCLAHSRVVESAVVEEGAFVEGSNHIFPVRKRELEDGRLVEVVEISVGLRGILVVIQDITKVSKDLVRLSLKHQRTIDSHIQALAQLSAELMKPANSIAGVCSTLEKFPCLLSERDSQLLKTSIHTLMLAVRDATITSNATPSDTYEVPDGVHP